MVESYERFAHRPQRSVSLRHAFNAYNIYWLHPKRSMTLTLHGLVLLAL